MKGKQSTFLDLVAEHQGILHKVCRLYAHSENDRQDLFQEILLQLWRAYDSFRGQAKVSTWMYRVALNTAISGLRKTSRRPEYTDLEHAAQRAADAPDPDLAEDQQLLYRAIGRLSEVERAIIMLYLEEQSYEEIAEVIGITPNYVGVKLTRIRNKLKEILTPHMREEPS